MGKKRTNRKYSDEQIDFVTKLVNEGKDVTPSTVEMCEHFDIKYTEGIGRTFRDKMRKLGLTNNSTNGQPLEECDEFQEAKNKVLDKTKKVLFFSWAQSLTDIHKNFFDNIEDYARERDAGIHIIAGRYRNPTSLSKSKNLVKDEKSKAMNWDPRVTPYLDAARHSVHKYLSILSDVKVQPTASTPLSGFNGITGLESCIVGHPRVHMRSLPVLDGYPNKLLLSTGSVTVENYTDTKSGKKGEFHHQLGFIIVELDGDDFHIRQITADDDGNFFDLKYEVRNGKTTVHSKPVKGIVMGDLHVGEEDKEAVDATFGIIKYFNPDQIVIHDAFNGHSISHHEKRDPFQLLRREEDGSWSLREELKELKRWFKKYTYKKMIVVRSNHDDFLDRWLMGEDWRKSSNKALYLKYASILAEGKAPKGIIPYFLEKHFDNVLALRLDDSHRIGDFECAIHGHIGASGSRGSLVQFKNLNTKNITGHSHTPAREDGHLCVGTLTKLRVGYNKGMSSWMHSNVIIYPNGKASHINIVNGKFTTMNLN